MKAKTKSLAYATRVKDLLVEMQLNGKLPQDMSKLNTKGIENILLPVFNVINTLKEDAEMALNGDWDYQGKNGEEGFKEQLKLIKTV